MPPAPGCVDQQLTALSTELVHNELDIPQAPASTPYALQILLDMFRVQYMNMINQMKTPVYRVNIENHIKQEKVGIYCILCVFWMFLLKVLAVHVLKINFAGVLCIELVIFLNVLGVLYTIILVTGV